jgi:hypothetical protein
LQAEASKDLQLATDAPIIRAEPQRKLAETTWGVKRVNRPARLRERATTDSVNPS